jgi:sulfur carrier protein ThiS
VVGYFAVRVILLPQNKTVTFSGRLRVAALLEKLALLPATVMVIRDNRLLTEDDLIQDEDDVEIRSVISGGL